MQCYYVTGDFDLVLVITAPDLPDYRAFTKQFIPGNPNIRRFSTMAVMNGVKFGTMIPIRPRD
jgi:Lrp/AsnC family leucine-responsive transcriptional regulator